MAPYLLTTAEADNKFNESNTATPQRRIDTAETFMMQSEYALHPVMADRPILHGIRRIDSAR